MRGENFTSKVEKLGSKVGSLPAGSSLDHFSGQPLCSEDEPARDVIILPEEVCQSQTKFRFNINLPVCDSR